MIIYLIGIIYFASYLLYVLVFAFRKRRLLENVGQFTNNLSNKDPLVQKFSNYIVLANYCLLVRIVHF